MRHERALLEAWQFTRGIDAHSAQRVADERGGGDVRVSVLTAGPAWLRVEMLGGESKPGSLLFLSGRGLFEVTRRDEWRAANGGTRVLLTLRTAPGE